MTEIVSRLTTPFSTGHGVVETMAKAMELSAEGRRNVLVTMYDGSRECMSCEEQECDKCALHSLKIDGGEGSDEPFGPITDYQFHVGHKVYVDEAGLVMTSLGCGKHSILIVVDPEASTILVEADRLPSDQCWADGDMDVTDDMAYDRAKSTLGHFDNVRRVESAAVADVDGGTKPTRA